MVTNSRNARITQDKKTHFSEPRLQCIYALFRTLMTPKGSVTGDMGMSHKRRKELRYFTVFLITPKISIQSSLSQSLNLFCVIIIEDKP